MGRGRKKPLHEGRVYTKDPQRFKFYGLCPPTVYFSTHGTTRGSGIAHCAARSGGTISPVDHFQDQQGASGSPGCTLRPDTVGPPTQNILWYPGAIRPANFH